MSKQTNNRIEKLEHISAVEMAKAVCAMKGNHNPTKEQIERVVQFMRPENFAAFLTEGLERRITQISKVEKSR